jgi:hypothetical protein
VTPECKGSKNDPSGKALSVSVFAAFHELASGKKVTSVFRRDHTGDAADPDGIAELECNGLVLRNGTFRISEPKADDSPKRC